MGVCARPWGAQDGLEQRVLLSVLLDRRAQGAINRGDVDVVQYEFLHIAPDQGLVVLEEDNGWAHVLARLGLGMRRTYMR